MGTPQDTKETITRLGYDVKATVTNPEELIDSTLVNKQDEEVRPETLHQPQIKDFFNQSKLYRQEKTPITKEEQEEQAGPSGYYAGKSNTCHICHKVFANAAKLEKHMVNHSSPVHTHTASTSSTTASATTTFKCEQCKKSFSTKFKLVRHVLIHSDRKQFSCVVCERTFHRKDHLKNHVKVHSPCKTFYVCRKPDCKKEYTSHLSYRKHVAMHAAEEGSLTCQICSKSFESKEEILYHLKIHAGSRSVKSPNEKKFNCDSCDRKFFTRKDVRRHMVVHTGMRDFLCQFCPQRFGRKDHLVRHIKKSHSKMQQQTVSTSNPAESSVISEAAGIAFSTSTTSQTSLKEAGESSSIFGFTTTSQRTDTSQAAESTSLLIAEAEATFPGQSTGQYEHQHEHEQGTSTSTLAIKKLSEEDDNKPTISTEDFPTQFSDIFQDILPETVDPFLALKTDEEEEFVSENLPLPGFTQTFQSPPTTHT